MTEFRSSHHLLFETAPWEASPEFLRYRVGTCEGLFGQTQETYDILAITNNEPGNGHFDDVLEWFENSCKRDQKHLRILEVWNTKLEAHMIRKRGFKAKKDYLIKKFYKMK